MMLFQYEPALHTAASIYIFQELCYLHIFQMARNIQKFASHLVQNKKF